MFDLHVLCGVCVCVCVYRSFTLVWLKGIVLLPFLPLLLCWLMVAILYHLDNLFVHLLTVNTSQVFASSPDVCQVLCSVLLQVPQAVSEFGWLLVS